MTPDLLITWSNITWFFIRVQQWWGLNTTLDLNSQQTSHTLPYPHSKVPGPNMGPIWGRQDPGGPHVGPRNFAIWVVLCVLCCVEMCSIFFRGPSQFRDAISTEILIINMRWVDHHIFTKGISMARNYDAYNSQLLIPQYLLVRGNNLCPIRQEAIPCANNDSDHCGHRTTSGHNKGYRFLPLSKIQFSV